ncbi:MAG: NUDIX domain-containing protein [Cyclobacteriaceae bacterium]|jgi:ADP-ribose pyrophosphatase YjhB (NUDIX family)
MIKRYAHADRLLVAVDCIIFGFDKNQLNLLLTKRALEPEKGKWSLIGGFVGKDESLDDAATRILHKLTGLKNIYMEEVKAFSEVKRDPVERTLSVAYYALIKMKPNMKLSAEYGAKWETTDDIPQLIFDHLQMVEAAKKKLKTMAKHQPIGFELLPKKFTIPQLRILYEAIYEKELDKRNFSRKILSMNLLEKLDEKDKKSSKKGAYLYRFDKKRYIDLVRNGLSFVI